MADTAVQVETPNAAASPAPAVIDRGAARAERRASAIARVQAAGAPSGASAADAPKPAPVETAKPAEPIRDEKPDPATDRGLRTIEQAKKRWMDEQQAKETDYQVRIAKLAEREKTAEGKLSSRDELKKLSPTDLLDALDHFTEDDHDILSRAAYARTKAGKVDPRAQAAAQEASRAQGGKALEAQLKAAHAEIAELRDLVKGEFTRRDQASFAERWVGEAMKAIPADKPTFLAKLHANEPDAARRELLTIGAELEKANDGEPPTQAEVIAEFETRKRAELKRLGLDPDALLAPPKPATAPAPKPAPARTLDVAATNVTRPEHAPKTRDERRALALENLRASKRATADRMP